MKQRSTSARSSRSSAFTLVELLVVIGIIGIMAGVIGIGLKGGDSSAGMRSAQSTLTTMVSAARGQAALNQTTSRLIVFNNPTDTERYLRFVQVVTLAADGATWVGTNDGVFLPNGVYVVPPTSGAVPVATGVTWPTAGTSKNLVTANMTIAPLPAASYFYLEFTSLGTASTGTFAVSTAKRTDATTLGFDNPANVRGLLVRNLGGVTLLNDVESFP